MINASRFLEELERRASSGESKKTMDTGWV